MQCNLPPRWSVWQDVKQFFKGAKTIKTTRWMYAGILIAALAAGADALGAGGKGGRGGRGGGGDLPDPNQSTKREASATRRDGSRMSEAQQQNVQKLKSDLLSIKQGSQVTTEQKQALKNDLMAMADGATKPDQALVQTLANDLSQAMSDGKMTTTEKAKLAKDLEAVMNCANIPLSEVQAAITDAQAILAASGIMQQEVRKGEAGKLVTRLPAVAQRIILPPLIDDPVRHFDPGAAQGCNQSSLGFSQSPCADAWTEVQTTLPHVSTERSNDTLFRHCRLRR